MKARLSGAEGLPTTVQTPGYTRHDHASGIVHLGLGAFFKAHLAVYTDDALAASGGNWRITGVSLRSQAAAEDLMPQDALYTVIERSSRGTNARVIGALASALCLVTHREAVLQALCDPATRIVSLTVTEKGYGLNRQTGGIDRAHPAIAADLADPKSPTGVAGLLVWALGQRRAAGIPPFTVLCCDNLPENGSLLRSLLVDFARHTAPHLVEHIAHKIACPATMVDRITPASNAQTLRLAQDLTDRFDAAAIETEAFRQWVIEDDFPTGRPDWAAGGALFTHDVRPFEKMKLRMLNGAHSMLAYCGFLAGHRYVRDVMCDPALADLVARHLNAAAQTLDAVPGMDLDRYAQELTIRFANPHLAHETYQIAMDGSEKMPQRIFAPARTALRRGQSPEPFAFATAAWMRYTLGRNDQDASYDLRDPLSAQLQLPAGTEPTPEALYAHLTGIPGLIPQELPADQSWAKGVQRILQIMLTDGMARTIQIEAARHR